MGHFVWVTIRILYLVGDIIYVGVVSRAGKVDVKFMDISVSLRSMVSIISVNIITLEYQNVDLVRT